MAFLFGHGDPFIMAFCLWGDGAAAVSGSHALQGKGFAGGSRILKELPLFSPPDERKADQGASNPEAILPVERKRS